MESGRAVLLIADIGGYTDYMSTHRMSLAHAEVNTARMLDKMIDAAPGYELIEIEGDAAFLSRPAVAPETDGTVLALLQVALAMHRAFHLERQNVAANLCPCTGCKGAANLKLKFVAHIGDVATQTIRQRQKLVGIDVILAHRWLKNPVTIPEYVLLSEELYGAGDHLPSAPVQEISDELEGIGTARAFVLDIGDLGGGELAAAAPLPAPRWSNRLGRTFAAAGLGLPYMLGLRRPRAEGTR
ncbi:DUF2652 domain-containing protein [Microterricola viridarii]|uniref:Guanylate cyclase domain-containing protein n=1 Tax=Microterricola viridarii TaxID=412690 RepID=A0A1H1P6I4_9MICO|nr:DUF2652 domain-containing protein [Microterricola viridarii]SDS06802.1 Protein of unknown function [Microterricola viridarii]